MYTRETQRRRSLLSGCSGDTLCYLPDTNASAVRHLCIISHVFCEYCIHILLYTNPAINTRIYHVSAAFPIRCLVHFSVHPSCTNKQRVESKYTSNLQAILAAFTSVVFLDGGRHLGFGVRERGAGSLVAPRGGRNAN
jgi:hypothetical protein